MRNLYLSDFQAMTGISDATLGYLLKEGLLPCSLDQQRLQVDVESLPLNNLLSAIMESKKKALQDYHDIAIERITVLLSDYLEKIMEEAVQELLERQPQIENRTIGIGEEND